MPGRLSERVLEGASHMQLLIDGYNVLFQSGLLPARPTQRHVQRARQALLRCIATALPVSQRCNTTVVFDARDAPPDVPSRIVFDEITVCYAVGYATADELLVELIRRAPQPSRLLVVSSDHAVQRAARARRAKTMDADQWLERLSRRDQRAQAGRNAATQGELSDKNTPDRMGVKEWLTYFGFEAVPDDATPSPGDAPVPQEACGGMHAAPEISAPRSPTDAPSGRRQPSDSSTRAERNAETPSCAPSDGSPKPVVPADAADVLFLEDPFPPGYAQPLRKRKRR